MSITELLGSDFWPRAAATGYTLSGLLLLVRVIIVPTGAPVAQAWPEWREGIIAAIGLFLAVIGWHWFQVAVDPGLDRAAWSEGLTPYSTMVGFLLGLPAALDLAAWQRLRAARR